MTWVRVLGSLLTRPARPPIEAFERSLIDAVIAAPEEDAPRLVYADWLSSRPEPELAARGELIVVQCALEGMNDPAEHNRLKARDFDLIEKFGSTWCSYVGLGEVRNNFYESQVEANFRRGFIDTVVTPLGSYAAIAVPLFTNETPEHLVLHGGHREVMARLGGSVYLRRVRSLALRRNWWIANALPALVGSPNVANLERLEISDSELAERDVDALCAMPATGVLRELALLRDRLDADAVVQIVASPIVARLEVLELDGNPIGDRGARALVEAPALAKLRRLSLAEIELSPSVQARVRARFGDAVTV